MEFEHLFRIYNVDNVLSNCRWMGANLRTTKIAIAIHSPLHTLQSDARDDFEWNNYINYTMQLRIRCAFHTFNKRPCAALCRVGLSFLGSAAKRSLNHEWHTQRERVGVFCVYIFWWVCVEFQCTQNLYACSIIQQIIAVSVRKMCSNTNNTITNIVNSSINRKQHLNWLPSTTIFPWKSCAQRWEATCKKNDSESNYTVSKMRNMRWRISI